MTTPITSTSFDTNSRFSATRLHFGVLLSKAIMTNYETSSEIEIVDLLLLEREVEDWLLLNDALITIELAFESNVNFYEDV
jgi:hypothetical protein